LYKFTRKEIKPTVVMINFIQNVVLYPHLNVKSIHDIWNYQSGFGHNVSTTDQIFCSLKIVNGNG
jgi:hypothetical protein